MSSIIYIISKISVSDVISVFALFFSFYVFLKNQLYSTYLSTIKQEQTIFDLKTKLEEAFTNVFIFKNDEDEIMRNSTSSSLKTALKNLISAYETFCEMYYKRQIPKSLFLRKYKDEIVNLFENPDYSVYLTSEYKYLVKFYNSL